MAFQLSSFVPRLSSCPDQGIATLDYWTERGGSPENRHIDHEMSDILENVGHFR